MASEAGNGYYQHCPNSGHFAHLDDHEIWDKSVVDFLTSN
jgi:pimeloyl-ACP methyl ester carboxylesterase